MLSCGWSLRVSEWTTVKPAKIHLMPGCSAGNMSGVGKWVKSHKYWLWPLNPVWKEDLLPRWPFQGIKNFRNIISYSFFQSVVLRSSCLEAVESGKEDIAANNYKILPVSHIQFYHLEIALQGAWYVFEFAFNHVLMTWLTFESSASHCHLLDDLHSTSCFLLGGINNSFISELLLQYQTHLRWGSKSKRV